MEDDDDKPKWMTPDQEKLEREKEQVRQVKEAVGTAAAAAAAERILEQQQQEEEQDALYPGARRVNGGKAQLELATLSKLYREDFDSLQVYHDTDTAQAAVLAATTGASERPPRIFIRYCDTYQGRLPGSMNGCTVIAPLLCIHHLIESNQLPDNDGLDNGTIRQVIDEETPIILQELRHSLGLSEHAFLIPADVHDYLIANGQLHTSQFVTVSGGNLLDDGHLQTFVAALQDNPHKLAATLFFHEHVVAILKIRKAPRHHHHHAAGRSDHANQDDDVAYDIIDSLPLKKTVRRHGNGSSSPHQQQHERAQVDSFLLNGDMLDLHSFPDYQSNYNNDFDDFDDFDDEGRTLTETAIFRCSNADALMACLRWYACSKFTKENMQYIDTYEWDDGTSDFDPRVFQAFVWGTPPTM